jgi:oxygen-dependent protoporphyrinogen oxidase
MSNSSTRARPHVVVVGGGISGLTTAYFLRNCLGDGVELTLLEAGSKLGGKISTQQFSGHLLDTGPDALLVRQPLMAALVEELGIGDKVVAPSALGANIWSRGRLRKLPTGTLFGIPDRILPLLRSRLISPTGLARAALDLVLPSSRRSTGDPTVADLVVPRLGSQVFNRLVEPLLGGVYAGQATELSAHSIVPEIEALARSRSLYFGLRRMRRDAPPRVPGTPILVTLEGGLAVLIDALAARLAGDDVRLDASASLISRADGGYRVDLADGSSIAADAVVLATPAFVSAGLLANLAPDAATVLAEIPYADVATICLAYPRSALGQAVDGTGFLVPPQEGKLLVGCTWSSAKWPHLADDTRVLIRAMVGRRGDRRWLDLDDDTLVSRVHDELVEAMGMTAGPVASYIQPWPQAMPQYVVGHQARLDALKAATDQLPGLYLTGAAYRGVGIASCVADAERTAQEIAQKVEEPRTIGLLPN